MARPFNSPIETFFGEDGKPLAGGKAYFYARGTTDLATIYADPNGTVELVQPVVLNLSGACVVYVDVHTDVVTYNKCGAMVDTIPGVMTSNAELSGADFGQLTWQ